MTLGKISAIAAVVGCIFAILTRVISNTVGENFTTVITGMFVVCLIASVLANVIAIVYAMGQMKEKTDVWSVLGLVLGFGGVVVLMGFFFG